MKESRARGWKWVFVVGASLSLVSGCGQKQVTATQQSGTAGVTAARDLPAPGPPVTVADGIVRYEAKLPGLSGDRKVWIYLPVAKAKTSLPVVLVAPAGTPLIVGNTQGEDGMPEHLPYAQAGFAVIAYEIDGPIDIKPTTTRGEFTRAVRAFMKADAGVANARQALNYGLAKFPQLDVSRIYTAGHSSAATLSLQVAENEPRVRACIAYAPICDVLARVSKFNWAARQQMIPDLETFLERTSPLNNTERLRCPIFIFHADDDSNVPTSDNTAFVAKLRQTNSQVTFARVPTGNHYESMIAQGIPSAIRWLRALPAASDKSKKM